MNIETTIKWDINGKKQIHVKLVDYENDQTVARLILTEEIVLDLIKHGNLRA